MTRRSPDPLEDERSVQTDIDAQQAIEAIPGAQRWNRPNVGRSKHD